MGQIMSEYTRGWASGVSGCIAGIAFYNGNAVLGIGIILAGVLASNVITLWRENR